MHAGQIAVLLLAALAAGWVDAVVGGGGLLQLPALLLAGLPPVQALATNKCPPAFLVAGPPPAQAPPTKKCPSFLGTAPASVASPRRTKLDRTLVAPAAGL